MKGGRETTAKIVLRTGGNQWEGVDVRTLHVPGQLVVLAPAPQDPGRHVDAAAIAPARDVFERYAAVGLGAGLVLAGIVALVVGWYGVASRTVLAFQLPYLITGGLVGVVLVLTGVVVLAVASIRRAISDAEAVLVAVLAVPSTASEAADTADDDVLAAPAGVTYHQLDCRLAESRGNRRLARHAALAEGLRPCLVCHRPDDRPRLPEAADVRAARRRRA